MAELVPQQHRVLERAYVRLLGEPKVSAFGREPNRRVAFRHFHCAEKARNSQPQEQPFEVPGRENLFNFAELEKLVVEQQSLHRIRRESVEVQREAGAHLDSWQRAAVAGFVDVRRHEKFEIFAHGEQHVHRHAIRQESFRH